MPLAYVMVEAENQTKALEAAELNYGFHNIIVEAREIPIDTEAVGKENFRCSLVCARCFNYNSHENHCGVYGKVGGY